MSGTGAYPFLPVTYKSTPGMSGTGAYLIFIVSLNVGQMPQGLGLPGLPRACFRSEPVNLKTYFLLLNCGH